MPSEVYQYSREELLSMNIRQIRSPEFIPDINDQIKKSIHQVF